MMAMDLLAWIQTWDWGSTADWVSGLATTAAVVFAVVGLRSERQRDRELNKQISDEQAQRDYAEKSSQASKVTVWHNDNPEEIRLRNGSEAVIYDVYVAMVNGNGESQGLHNPPADFTRMLRVVPPGETVSVVAPEGWRGAGFVPSYDLTFRDSQGVTWFRSNWGNLVERKKDVFEHYGLSRPFSYYQPPPQVL